jgi:hypothetical protein
MAQFKCKLSGVVVSFEYEHDIKSMLKHPQYELVDETPVKKVTESLVKEKTVSVKPSVFNTKD